MITEQKLKEKYHQGKQAGQRIRSDRLLTENNELKKRINALEYYDTSKLRLAKEQGKVEAIQLIKRYSKFHIPKAIGDEMIKELKEQKQEVEK